ncbi:CHRD domain-containing protein [Noviherbaspirillum saxi]|nr:CHRD domain-containing protein [Noviherbaspirillum saxi]
MNTFFLRIFYIVCGCLLLSSCGGGHDTALRAFNAILIGAEQVPPTASNAFGTAIVTVNRDSGAMVASIVTTGLNDGEAHLHLGAPGTAGPAQFALTRGQGATVWLASAVLTEAQWLALRSGNFYIDVHSATFPNGEIRGQLVRGFPFSDQIVRLQQARTQSPLVDEQLRQLDEIEDAHDGIFTGIGLTIGF